MQMTHADVAMRERIFERPDFSATPRADAVASSELDFAIHYDLAAAEPAWRELQATGRWLELSAFRIEPSTRNQVAVLFQDLTARRRAASPDGW